MTGERNLYRITPITPTTPITLIIHPLRAPRSSALSQGDSQLLLGNAITHFLPLRQGEGVE